MLNQLMQLISILNSKTKPGELALGVVMGMYAGFLSGAPLDLVIIFMLLVIFNANITMFIFSMAAFKLLAFGVDIAGDKLGYAVLTIGAVKKAGVVLMSLPVIPFTKFNYTVIMGDFLIAVALTPFVWFGTVKSVPFYRDHIMEKVDKFKVVKMIKASNAFKTYNSFRGQ